MDTILVINAGSSDLRFQIYSVEGEGRLRQQLKGRMDGIGRCPRLRVGRAGGSPLANRAYPVEAVPDIPAAMDIAGAWLRDELHIHPVAVGHRVAHGGAEHDRPVLIDHGVMDRLERLTAFAPLHLPHNLAPIRSILASFPKLPQVACFDTAFHRTHAAVADHYAIPRTLYAEGVRRYGFHGLSYEYIAKTLSTVAPDIAMKRVIVADLGSAASMCALSGGRSVESTMGFTAIDPGVLLYLISEKGMAASEVQRFLDADCGLKGLSGISGDMRQLEASEDASAKFAIDYFVYRIGLNTGMLVAALQGLDAFVFTAGVGENSALIRSRVAEQLGWLGVKLDLTENALQSQLISSPASRIPVYVVRSDEDLMIARHTLALLMNGSSMAPS
ncbi:acetate/propionate family kinase [Bradyrhizobium sp. LLZ17]|uniref:Acetate kinase n=1 Tax=Bradyrhizobium sp. LLZ17 TaxID=3239388 RepID=A0AB39XLW3_9BRAD